MLYARMRETKEIVRIQFKDIAECSIWWHEDEKNQFARKHASEMNKLYDFWQLIGTFVPVAN